MSGQLGPVGGRINFENGPIRKQALVVAPGQEVPVHLLARGARVRPNITQSESVTLCNTLQYNIV